MGACVRATVEWTRACTGGLQPGTLLASCVTWAVRPLGSLFPVYTAGRERGIPAPQQVGEAAGEVGGGPLQAPYRQRLPTLCFHLHREQNQVRPVMCCQPEHAHRLTKKAPLQRWLVPQLACPSGSLGMGRGGGRQKTPFQEGEGWRVGRKGRPWPGKPQSPLQGQFASPGFLSFSFLSR